MYSFENKFIAFSIFFLLTLLFVKSISFIFLFIFAKCNNGFNAFYDKLLSDNISLTIEEFSKYEHIVYIAL